MSNCGCNSNPSPPTPPPVYPVQQPTPEPGCPNSHCDNHFVGLAKRNNLTLVGLLGNCFRTLAGVRRGLLVNEPDGSTYSTDHIGVELPVNSSYQRNPDGSPMLDSNGQPILAAPPAFPSLMGIAAGIWKQIIGRSGQRQQVVWDGAQWVIENVPDWGGSRPLTDYPQATNPCGVELLGIVSQAEEFTDECGRVAQRQVATVKRLAYVPGVVGEIKAFAGPTSRVPAGYLLCNGQPLLKENYPELFAAIGYAWGGADASFNLPDLRGRFMRGLDNGAGRDPSNSRSVGSYQDDAVIQHQHQASFEQADSPSAVFQLNLGEAAAPEENTSRVSVYSSGGTLGSQNISAVVSGLGLNGTVTGVTGTDKVNNFETRPTNAAVNYIIFVGCTP